MRKSTQRLALATLMMFTLSCGSGGDFNLISLEEEWQLGNQLAQDISRQMRVRQDPYLTELGNRLKAQTSMANLPFNFYIVEDPAINAFAIPGGHVYVHTGLINAARNASELAGVLGHEISHVVARHSTEQISRQYGISVLAGAILGQNPAAYQQILAQVLAGGALARFSREAENEADRIGLQAMVGAGYNGNGMVTMFQKLLEQRKSRPSSLEQFFSTHPLTEDRIRNIQSDINRMGVRSGARTDEAGFQTLKSRV